MAHKISLCVMVVLVMNFQPNNFLPNGIVMVTASGPCSVTDIGECVDNGCNFHGGYCVNIGGDCDCMGGANSTWTDDIKIHFLRSSKVPLAPRKLGAVSSMFDVTSNGRPCYY